MKKIFPLLLLVFTYPLGQLYMLFDNEKYNSMGQFNLVLFKYRPMLISWNVNKICNEVIGIMVAVAFYLIVQQLKASRQTVTIVFAYMWYKFFDLLFWFINFKTTQYGWIFVLVCILEIYKWLKLQKHPK